MYFEKLCNNLMETDKNVRFVIILSNYGEKIAGGFRQNTTSFLSPDEIKMSLFYVGQRWDTRTHLSHRIGKAKYSITEYEKVKQFTLPVDDKHLLLISKETNANSDKIIENASRLIKQG